MSKRLGACFIVIFLSITYLLTFFVSMSDPIGILSVIGVSIIITSVATLGLINIILPVQPHATIRPKNL